MAGVEFTLLHVKEYLLFLNAQTPKEAFAAKLPAEIERVRELRSQSILQVHLCTTAFGF